MAPRSQSDLAKIGLEGFALIDEFFGRKSRPQAPPPAAQRARAGYQANQQDSHFRYPSQESYYRYQPQEPQVVRVTKVYNTKEAIVMKSSYETAAPQTFGVSYY